MLSQTPVVAHLPEMTLAVFSASAYSICDCRPKPPFLRRQDDLHLAAKLGKTLLDRNRDLEQGLQQMYTTNQEQLQEMEVEMLRQMNDQHAKVYETLDLSTRDLERGNQRLVQDNRLAYNKIHSLTESTDALQTHVEDLQNQVEALMSAQVERNKQEANTEQRRSLGAQSLSCLKELYHLHQDRCVFRNTRQMKELRWPEGEPEEEHAALLRSLRTLEAQLAAEKGLREAVEREKDLTSKEKRDLEQQLLRLEVCPARHTQLQAQVERMRLLWRADCAARTPPRELPPPDAVLFTPEENPEEGQAETEEAGRNSEVCAREVDMDDHDRMCVRRAEVVKQRGISLLNEVDAQYNALQVKYEQLLQRCQQASEGLTHKSVQTSCRPLAGDGPCRRSARGFMAVSEEPEYKVLFKEIFTCIQKTKDDLQDNRLFSQRQFS
ncbi:cerebellar degeneration-related protein 2 isoform X2 [Nerophis ophidion]|uniref:cerebellar degeneration-related protein 2 isoform X2 n=1 Tax=Nerophis ophidion TaxID=159077 RepID=UPI002AE097D4|nr:cerebellar degeneration-related protein 2 isoform X2 [Nerophis ophidion]